MPCLGKSVKVCSREEIATEKRETELRSALAIAIT